MGLAFKARKMTKKAWSYPEASAAEAINDAGPAASSVPACVFITACAVVAAAEAAEAADAASVAAPT